MTGPRPILPLATPTCPLPARHEPLDPRVLVVLETLDGYASQLSTATRLSIASFAVKAIDQLEMDTAKALHPSSPTYGSGSDCYLPGPDVALPDDHTVTDPHALWGTYHHETGGAA